jgi:flavorubredoxin/flavin reductase (DIM6/NTAB) family NADH-FMN oxidoreductase RutF
MILLQERLKGSSLLTLQAVEIATDTTAIRSLDWDRDRFDIEFELQNGTTYNSFIIRGDQTALIDTSHQKFRALYMDALRGLIDLTRLDYLIVSHTEPDHSGLVKDVLELAPQVTVVGAKVAIQFLENMVHRPFRSQIVKQGDRLDLGQGHALEFISAPNLHWPDTIFTHDARTKTLFTCDAFGMHYCDDHAFDEVPQILEADFKTYYDCLMGPNARSVLAAIKRMEPLTIEMIATGHGPLLKHHRDTWVNCYREWSAAQASTEPIVSVFFTEDYGYSHHLAQKIGLGIAKTGVEVELIDLNTIDQQDVRDLVNTAAGLVIGMPSQTDATAQTNLSTILASAHSKQAIGFFESGGAHDEPLYPLRNKFREVGVTELFPPILLKELPTVALDQCCEEAGTDLGQWLTRDRTVKQMKSLDTDLDRALGRLSGGLYIITSRKGAHEEAHDNSIASAMLASWVTQASLSPLGVAIGVAKDRAIEALLHPGDRFVLNVLEENNYQPLMRHFLKRFQPGANRFAGVKTYDASNGSPILADALAYMECEVTSRMDCGDHWVIYSSVQAGRVAKAQGVTAVHHRKVGNHY